jgi:tRNA pseudouridine55 synthase
MMQPIPATPKPAKLKTVWQTVNGIVLLDKGLGASSNQALQQVRRVFRAAKGGHTGTLDPLATGLLPLCLGEASKFAQGLLDADKTYTARLCLGITTTTGDAEGEVLDRQVVNFTRDTLAAVVAQFTGAIEQVPPMYSALKHQGRPLYELARQGIDIERKARVVTIYELSVLDSSFSQWQSPDNTVMGESGDVWIDIAAKVSKGTYIRTLGQDIGAALGCGAHLSALRRTAVADWTLADALPLEAFHTLLDDSEAALQSRLLPVDAMLAHCAIESIDAAQAELFSNGGRIKLQLDEGFKPDVETVRVYHGTKFLGVAALKQNVLHPVRLIGR